MRQMELIRLFILLCVFSIFTADDENLKFLEGQSMGSPIDDLPDYTDRTELNIVRGSVGYSSKNKKISNHICLKEPEKMSSSGITKMISKITMNVTEVISDFNFGVKMSLTLKPDKIEEMQKKEQASTKDIEDAKKKKLPFEIDVTLGLNYSHTFSENSTSLTYYFLTQHWRKTNFFYGLDAEDTLVPKALKIFENNPASFYEKCGDHVFTTVTEGGLILVEAKINFKSTSDKSRFGANFDLTAKDLASLAGDIDKTVTKNKIDGSISFKAMQLGGEDAQFNKAYPSDKSGFCSDYVRDSASHSSSLNECQKVLDEVYNYIRKDFPSQFPTDNAQRWHVFDFKTEPMDF